MLSRPSGTHSISATTNKADLDTRTTHLTRSRLHTVMVDIKPHPITN